MKQVFYKCRNFNKFEDIVKFFLSSGHYSFDYACFSVPAPVQKETSKLIDLPWHINSEFLSKVTRCPVALLNDAAAAAYGLSSLKDEELITIKEGISVAGGNRAVLAVGTVWEKPL